MPKKSSNIQKAELLTKQLLDDLKALESDKPGKEKEPPLPKKNGSKSITSDEIVANEKTIVNEKLSEKVKLAESWDEPIPLESTVTAQVFPVHCLPETLKNFALSVAEHNQTSIDMSAVSSLGVASTCLQGKYLVQGKAGWTVPLSNYYLIVGKPAERKSSVCSIYEEPITAYESRMNQSRALEIAQSENIKQVLEKELEALKSAAVKLKGKSKSDSDDFDSYSNPYAEIEAKQAEIHNHKDIKPLRLICGGDISLEALTSLLADNDGKMAMFNAEGGIFTILKGLYSQSPNIDTFLQAYCGDSIRVDRKGRPSEIIEKPCLTTLLFAQPDVLTEIVANMADWAGKLHGTVLRIAGLLHVVEGVSINSADFADIPFESSHCISKETMAAAIEIGTYFLAHAQVCYGYIGADENIDKAKYIVVQLEKKKATGDMRAYDIWRICRSKQHKIEKVEDIKPSLQILEDYGYIKAMSANLIYDKGRPTTDRYNLNPKHFAPA